MRILMVGLGSLGLPLAHRLLAKGHQVVGVKRSSISSEFPVYYGDIAEPSACEQINDAFDVVFYIVAPGSRQPDAYRRCYLDGLINLKQRFATLDCKPYWFYVSSSSVYGQNRGEWVDESSVTEAEKYTGKTLLEAEAQLAQSNATIIRFSGIYGPQRFRLLQAITSGKRIQRTLPYYTNRIHEQDCIGILLFLLDRYCRGQTLDTIYLASDDQPVDAWTINQWLAQQLAINVFANEETLSAQNKRCSNRRLRELGYGFAFPDYRTGYVEVLNNWRRRNA